MTAAITRWCICAEMSHTLATAAPFRLSYHYTEWLTLFQQYLAKFKIRHAMFALSDPQWAREPVALRCGLSIANVVLSMYEREAVDFVKGSVMDEIARLKASNDGVQKLAATELAKELKKWRKLEHPLCWDSYHNIRRMVDPSSGKLPPCAGPANLSRVGFVKLLIAHANKGTKTGPPFLPQGKLQHILATAMDILNLVAQQQRIDLVEWAPALFVRVLNLRNIDLLPWTPIPAPGEAQSRTVSYKAWLSFAENPTDAPLGDLRPQEKILVEAEKNQAKARLRDPGAKWDQVGILLQDLGPYLNRIILPEDFIEQPGAEDHLVRDTYRYVIDNINLNNPIHHLALIAGIVFSRLAPNLFTARPDILGSELQNAQETHAYLWGLPWSTRRTKGVSAQDILASMFTVYMLAYYDVRSPLMQHWRVHSNQGRWADKHSKSICTLRIL
jgi:hypothetical protein